MARLQKLLGGRLMHLRALRLVIRSVWAAYFGAFVPVDTQPAKPVQDRSQRFVHISLLIGIVDAKNELPAGLSGEQPIEQRRSHASDMKVAVGLGANRVRIIYAVPDNEGLAPYQNRDAATMRHARCDELLSLVVGDPLCSWNCSRHRLRRIHRCYHRMTHMPLAEPPCLRALQVVCPGRLWLVHDWHSQPSPRRRPICAAQPTAQTALFRGS